MRLRKELLLVPLILVCCGFPFAESCQARESGLSEKNKAPLKRVLKAQDREIVDLQNKPVRLRGIYTRSTWLDSEQEAEWFGDWNINFVRLLLRHDEDYWQVVNGGFEDVLKRCMVRPENLDFTEERIQWLRDQGIHVMLEIHWRALGITEEFTQPDLLKDQLISLYTMLAERYHEYGNLMGFCVFSEIYVASHYYDLYNTLCTAAVDAVHAVDPSYIVSVTGVQTSSPESMIDAVHVDRPNVIYDFHFYSPKMFTHYRDYYGDLRYPGWIADGWSGVQLTDINFLRDKLSPVFRFSKRWNVPVWCGEFGAFGNAPDGSSLRWERDVYYLLEEKNVPWILWRWKDKEKVIPEYWKEFWDGTFETRTVTLVPHGGPFADSARVWIHSTLSDCDIRYTLNGQDPDSESRIYKAPFTIYEDTSVRAAAFKEDKAVTQIDQAVFYKLEMKTAQQPGRVKPGLRYCCYAYSGQDGSAAEDLPLIKSGTTQTISIHAAQGENDIALVFEGYLKVPEPGMYYFYSSDAGYSELWIGNRKLIENPESRWLSRRSGFAALEAGYHPIKVVYRRSDKGQVYYSKNKKDDYLKIEYEGPDIQRQTLEPSMLYHE